MQSRIFTYENSLIEQSSLPLAECSPEIKSYYPTGQQAIQGYILLGRLEYLLGTSCCCIFSSQHMRVSNACNTEFRLLIILGDESIRLVRLCLQVKIFVL